ncbi:poly(R)-hydroxyalkanoic acid synthase subunit PhaE [Pseudoxanthomonas sp. 10H]|uniref:poly(R)-hydroxyalkanoic acid synthase subunit PhaE n=1 Tax=Pseudoxanthomonas sp. 10H TaxID=3242729 RepID=UPI00355935C1
MANAPFGHLGGDFESLARQYWNTWNELLGRGGMPDAWSLAGAMPPGLGGMGLGSYDWYQRMQRLAADFSGGGSAADVASAWRDMLGGQGADPFAGMLRSMQGGLAGGDWLEQMRPLLDMLLKPVRQQSAEWLQRPAFGPAREHQERLQALALAWQQWEESNEAFNAQLAQAGQSAFARFERLLAEHDAPGKRLESARALFDLWIDAAEEAWAEIALSTEYRHAYAEMTNALMRLRLRLQHEVEQFGALLGLPGRSELDALHRKVAELDRALHAARRGTVAPRATPAARKGAGARAATHVRAAAADAKDAAMPKAAAAAPRAAGRKQAVTGSRAAASHATPASRAAPAATAGKAATASKGVPKKAGPKPPAAKPAAARRTPTPAVAAKPPTAKAAKAAKTVPAAASAPAPAARRAAGRATAQQGPRASASAVRKPRAAGSGTSTRATAATAPSPATKVVSMKDWVSRNIAAGAPGKDGPGGKRKGRSR